MADNVMLELVKHLREFQDKFTYFLLTAAGAGVALSVNQTRGEPLMWSHMPLGFALLLWALSFYFGCQRLNYVGSNLVSNLELLKVKAREHPENGTQPQQLGGASEGIRQAIEESNKHGQSLWDLQFRLLVCGGVMYVVWHVLEMYLRGLKPAP
jgi:hypothetical protein